MNGRLLIRGFFCLLLSAAISCGGGTGPQVTEPREMEPVEILEYNGERLGSHRDFRENSIIGPQRVEIGSFMLRVDGMVERPLSFSYEQLLARPAFRKAITLLCVEGWSVKVLWEGFKLRDMLAEAGVRPGANWVKFHGADGYYTFLSLNYVTVRDLLVAYRMNGVPLRPERGFPLHLVAEDRLGYKWCRWLNRIELTDSSGAKGYWESQGYPAGGDPAEWF